MNVTAASSSSSSASPVQPPEKKRRVEEVSEVNTRDVEWDLYQLQHEIQRKDPSVPGKLSKLFPQINDPISLWRIANLCETARAVETAFLVYQKALDIAPNNPTILSSAIRFYFAQHAVSKATECSKNLYNSMLQIVSENKGSIEPDAVCLLGLALHMKGEYQEALKIVSSHLKQFPTNPTLLQLNQRITVDLGILRDSFSSIGCLDDPNDAFSDNSGSSST